MGEKELSNTNVEIRVTVLYYKMSQGRKVRVHIHSNDPNALESVFSLDNSTADVQFLGESTVLTG